MEMYQGRAGVPSFDLLTLPLESAEERLERGEAEALVTIRPPRESWMATPLGRESVAVIVSNGTPLMDLTLEGLSDLFSGRRATWGEAVESGVEVQPVIPLPGDPLREYFAARVLPGLGYSGRSLLAGNPEQMLRIVSEREGALGFLPANEVRGGVSALSIGGLRPGEEGYPLSVEILAIAPGEPQGEVRAFLVWIQEMMPDPTG
jgi:DNA-binding transcriptional LysR family regulator